jgi:glycosyltransferase involved in cell wall biosynthesis
MQKYLFVAANESSSWGGSEALWISAAEKLAQRGNEIRVSVPGYHKDLALLDSLRSAGCQIFYRPGFPPLFYRLRRKLFPLPEYKRTHVRSVAQNIDLVVISQGSNTDGLSWMEDARSAGHRYAVIAQGAAPHCWPDDELSQKLAESYEHASGAFFVSQAILDLSRNQFASPISDAKVIRNPFNVRYDARPPWPEISSNTLLLACVGRLDGATKGHDLLLQVLALPHWRQRDIRVSLVGTGPNERVLGRLAQHLNLTNVDFAGHQSNIENVWSRHHALVLASRFEGMPLVVVEAMLCGRPCIATDVGGSRELIRDGVNGFLAKAATEQMLDEAMNHAWDNRARLREMGEQAAVDVRQFVSPDPVEDFVRELEKICNGGR